MGSLGVRVLTHLPPKAVDRHTAARAKGKVERPFRTVKEVHETLYHFHTPKAEAEAQLWMRLARVPYNNGSHRSEPHARNAHSLRHLPGASIRALGSWERLCAFALKRERRPAAVDPPLWLER